jgi:hypothetical protein
MKRLTLNENISRIKQVMGILNEQEAQFHPATALIRKGYKGPGTDTNSLVKGFQLIKSDADYKKVESEVAQYGGYKTLLDVLNGELGELDLVPAQQIQTALKAAGLNLQFKPYINAGGYRIDSAKDFKLTTAAAPVAQPQVATSGWWDKYPGLAAYMKEKGGKVHYPPAANSQTGAIAIEMDGGAAHDFFPDGRWYQYATIEDGLKAVVKAQYEGKWVDRNGVLIINSSDGETWTSKTKTWAKGAAKMKWTKETGKFPLMYGQVGPTIKTLQLALGLKGDTYFGPVTEKYILAKAPEYKRETGVTDDIYNKIVNAAKPAAPAQPAATQPATPPPPTEAELQANPSTLNPY